MNKIDFPRIDVDGISHTRTEVETFFSNKFEKEIHSKLNNLASTFSRGTDERRVLDITLYHLHSIMLASPLKIEQYKKYVDSWKSKFSDSVWNGLRKEMLRAFNYNGYRQSGLVELAKMLNIKSCPYCNMHYTLYAESGRHKYQRLAKLQFDHFLDKADYPMFSMSLYNLIPSCAVCNQSKSNTQLPLSFHPYLYDIHSRFHFEVANILELYSGAKKDSIELDLVAEPSTSKTELDMYDNVFHLKLLYGRHKDLAQEVFDKAYEEPYYSNPSNFGFLGSKTPEYLEQLWLGNYTKTEDIEKRPMAKFEQDLWKQAKNII